MKPFFYEHHRRFRWPIESAPAVAFTRRSKKEKKRVTRSAERRLRQEDGHRRKCQPVLRGQVATERGKPVPNADDAGTFLFCLLLRARFVRNAIESAIAGNPELAIERRARPARETHDAGEAEIETK